MLLVKRGIAPFTALYILAFTHTFLHVKGKIGSYGSVRVYVFRLGFLVIFFCFFQFSIAVFKISIIHIFSEHFFYVRCCCRRLAQFFPFNIYVINLPLSLYGCKVYITYDFQYSSSNVLIIFDFNVILLVLVLVMLMSSWCLLKSVCYRIRFIFGFLQHIKKRIAFDFFFPPYNIHSIHGERNITHSQTNTSYSHFSIRYTILFFHIYIFLGA